MKSKIALLSVLMLLASVVFALAASDVPRMSTDELKSRLTEAGLVVVDVRTGSDWNGSDEMVAGAIRGNPNDIGLWLSKLNMEQTIVLYCS